VARPQQAPAYVFGPPFLHDPAEIHDRDTVAYVANHRQIVGNDQITQPMFGLQIGHQVQDLALYRDIEAGRGFICYDQLWIQR